MAEAEAVHRPITVAIVAVVAGLSGVVDVITGILLMFEGSNPEVADALGGSGGVLWASSARSSSASSCWRCHSASGWAAGSRA